MKKSYKVLLIIISVLLLFGLVTGYKYLYYNTDTNNNNVYIYGDWDNDISILKNEDIIIQVPIYDFNQEIDDNTSISIQNFDDGEIYNIELNNKQEFDEFTSYTLQFNMLFNRTGYFELDNIEAVINTSSNTYSTNLGNYSVMVYDENSISNDIEIVGGSALVETISDENTYLSIKELTSLLFKKEIVVDFEKTEDKTVSMKVDKGVWEDFLRLCSNTSHDRKTLLTQALSDFMKVHKDLL